MRTTATATIAAGLLLVGVLMGCGQRNEPHQERLAMPPTTTQHGTLVADADVMGLLSGAYAKARLLDRCLDDQGNMYLVDLGDGARCELLIALHASVRKATDAFAARSQMVAVGRSPAPPLGDERRLWRGADASASSILFRRANAVVHVSETPREEDCVALARLLDEAMKAGGPHVTLAPGVSPPTIVKVDLPDKMKPNQAHRAAIEVKDIASKDALIVAVGPSFVVEKTPEPVLVFTARPTPGEQRFLLVISSVGNLMSSKEVVVQVEDGQDSEGAHR